LEIKKVINNVQEIDISELKNNLQRFCVKNRINFNKVKEIGIKKSKTLLEQFFTNQLERDLSEKKYENLYHLFCHSSNQEQINVFRKIIDLIKVHQKKRKLKIKRILIIGIEPYWDFNDILKEYSKAKIIITDISKEKLKKVKNISLLNKNVEIEPLNIYNGRVLFNFVMEFGKFNLIIVSNTLNFAPNKKKRELSAHFIYQHILKKRGIFSIIELDQFNRFKNKFLLEGVIPLSDSVIRLKSSKTKISIINYYKNDINSSFKV